MRDFFSSIGAMKLLLSFFVVVSVSHAKVENSFNSQYSHYKDYHSSTPAYPYPEFTVKSVAGEISNNPLGGDQHQQDPLLSQGTAQQTVVQGAPNQHVYYYETYPMQDSSRGNIYGVQGSGGKKKCTYMGNGNVRCQSRQDITDDYDTTGDDGTGTGAGLGGLAGLVGLLGLKGLKGLASVLFPIIIPILFPLIFPLLLPVLLPLLLLLLLPILLLPIPVISIPAPAGRYLADGLQDARKFATGVYESLGDDCIERISCEISRMSQKRKASEWMEKALNYLPENNIISKRIFKGFTFLNSTATTEEGKPEKTTCIRLKCRIFNFFESSKSPSG